jgi:hypothetical protein
MISEVLSVNGTANTSRQGIPLFQAREIVVPTRHPHQPPPSSPVWLPPSPTVFALTTPTQRPVRYPTTALLATFPVAGSTIAARGSASPTTNVNRPFSPHESQIDRALCLGFSPGDKSIRPRRSAVTTDVRTSVTGPRGSSLRGRPVPAEPPNNVAGSAGFRNLSANLNGIERDQAQPNGRSSPLKRKSKHLEVTLPTSN